ncbi:para-nitrobenzyl esterase-like [Halictus rubicundus]|uniref:para-nitrobenzyl esterase-like n=1 Tax=Halictus rubicundus TaxID=77578 RepID=UPI004034F859
MENNSVREYVLVILSIFLATCIRCQALQKTVVIETELGPVVGYDQKTLYRQVSYSTFKGIGYAQPPIGHLRYKPPVPKTPWTEVFEATEEGPTCPQYDTAFLKNTYMGDEDCLHLNVYTPVLDFNSTVKYPVMVWIYGGGFAQGYKNQSLYGPDLFIEEGVIMVVPNYRLGALGFLNLGHPDAHGNAGMMDQVMALKWVQKNIAKFGGDPNNVTVFGESAGSSSVILHELSPQSKGLYQRTIAESGAPLILLSQSPLAALTSAYWLAHLLGFHTTSRERLLEFYQNANPYDLVMKTSNMYIFPDILTRAFQPSIEDTRVANQSEIFLAECPITLMMEGQIRKGPKMIGFNENEFYAFAKAVGVVDVLNLFLPYNVTVEIVSAVTQLLSNMIMAAEIDMTQRFYAAHNELHPVYYYILTYTGFPHHMITDLPVKKATHVDDVGLLFTSLKYGFSNSTDPNDPLNVFRRKMVQLWVNFAKGSNPTPTFNNPINATWEPSGSSGRQFNINWDFKMIPRALGAFGFFVESIYYFLLPLLSSCKQISYATPYTDLFSLNELNISLHTPLSFPNITSLLNPETIISTIPSFVFNS